MLSIGPYQLQNRLILAPMAGVTDRPFRQLCREHGAALAVSEMVIADPSFWKTRKSKHRLDHSGESAPISVQIAGGDPEMLAQAAKLNADMGAQIIDINMGCPAKKVCNKAAGSALMKDEKLVQQILEQVVNAVDIPVTLKIRTGWDTDNKNAPTIAKIAEEEGISALAIHGRTKACLYKGEAEYDTIAQVKQSLGIPVFANGDITTPEKAAYVLKHTNADGLLIGRGAQGKPWIFNEINYFLEHGVHKASPSPERIRDIMLGHLRALHNFYGDPMGHRIARKHIGWYLGSTPIRKEFKKHFNTIEDPQAQFDAIYSEFEDLIQGTGVYGDSNYGESNCGGSNSNELDTALSANQADVSKEQDVSREQDVSIEQDASREQIADTKSNNTTYKTTNNDPTKGEIAA